MIRFVRVSAAKAFHEANSDRALRASFLARGRQDPTSFQIGSYVYYFRAQAPDNKGGKLTPSGRWRGPALVCAIEERAGKQDVIWVAHGTSLVRAAPEQLRLELPPERAHRLLQSPASEATVPVMDQVRAALRPARGPVRSLDLLTHPAPTIASAELDHLLRG